MRRFVLALSFLLSVPTLTVHGQAPPPVPALPDTERRTTYNVTATQCNCPVQFGIYGDGTDYQNWIQVWLNGVIQDPTTYTITSPSGPLATRPRPITDAVLNFNTPVTGQVDIVGARRPRRNQLFTENRGVPARDANQITNDIQAEAREAWDLRDRVLQGKPGTIYQQMPVPAECSGKLLGFDVTGTQPICTTPSSSVTLTLSSGSVTNDILAPMPEHTIKCNPTGITAPAQDCTGGTVTPMLSQFTDSTPGLVPPPGAGTTTSLVFLRGDRQWTSSLSPSPPILTILTSGMTGVFTPSPGVLFLAVELCGGGGGGGQTGTLSTAAMSGSASTLGYNAVSTTTLYLSAEGGGIGRNRANSGLGGSATDTSNTPQVVIKGSRGSPGSTNAEFGSGGTGGVSPFGGAGAGATGFNPGFDADVNSCSGGGGAGMPTLPVPPDGVPSGGGAGGYIEKILTQPLSASYPFTVGEGGRGATGGVQHGGRGGGGTVSIWMFFQ